MYTEEEKQGRKYIKQKTVHFVNHNHFAMSKCCSEVSEQHKNNLFLTTLNYKNRAGKTTADN
jgi:hypothetical protein